MDTPTGHKPPDGARGRRLDSWKSIAGYLQRDVRTVQRWEKLEGLPVHRHLHDERATAYAFSGEIDEWMENRHPPATAAVTSPDGIPSPVQDVTSRSSPSASKRRLPIVAIALVLSVASLIGTWTITRPRHDPTPLSGLSVVFAPSERFREWGPDMVLSPDGTTIVYSSTETNGGIRVRRIDRMKSEQLEGAFGYAPFFSPDGRWVGFNAGGQLMKIAIEGGAPIPLGVTSKFMGAADWGSDNYIVYAAVTPEGTHGLYRVHASGGTPELVSTFDTDAEEAYWLTPQSISNGAIILCTVVRAVSSGSRFQVVAVTTATGKRRVLVDNARHGLYLGDGVLVYLRDQTLFATRLELSRLEISGPQLSAWHDVFARVRLRSWTSAAGTLVYWPTIRVARRLVWVDRAGKQEPLPLPPALYQSPRVSPDGQSIVYGISESSEFGDVWKHDISTGATVQLTSDGLSGTPLWTPDGTSIVFSSLRPTARHLFRLRLGIATEPEPIHLPPALSGTMTQPTGWADDGYTLLVKSQGMESQPIAWAVPLDGSREASAVLPRNITRDNNFRVSPDRRWIAYAGGDAGTDVYVAPLPGGRPVWKVSSGGGKLPVWSRSGRELFYRRGDAVMAVPVTPGATSAFDTPRRLFEGRFFEAEPGGPNYDVTPDDQRFLMVLPGDTEGPDRLNVVQGWKADILRRLRKSS